MQRVIYGQEPKLDNMDISEIRLQNLGIIIKEDFGGVKTRLADKLGIESTYLSRFYATGDNKRNIGSKFARKIEKAAGRPEYWMDQPHEEISAESAEYGKEVDWTLFADILDVVNKALDEAGIMLPTSSKLELAEVFYDMNAEQAPKKAVVLKLARKLKTTRAEETKAHKSAL